MENNVLLAILTKLVDARIAALPVRSGQRGLRGRAGLDGVDGKDFNFADHEETIRGWAKEFALKFEDLTAEEIGALRGPAGHDGRDGKDFDFEEHSAGIQSLISKAVTDASEFLKLKFADLSADEISALRGPPGRDGREGKDFEFTAHEQRISEIIRSTVEGMSDELKIKFADLNADDIEQLRGPRGRDGHDGRSFNFEEHREFFESLRLKFSDLSAEDRDELRLRFSHLTEDEKSSLKLRFEDLTDEQKALIRGARGSRGQRGITGNDGKDGKDGQSIRGLPGPRGYRGFTGVGKDGKDGVDGLDGRDAPFVTDIELEEFPLRNEIAFRFKFSDGSVIETDRVELPRHTNIYVTEGSAGGGGGSGGGGEPGDPVPIQDEGVEVVAAPTAINFVGPGVNVTNVGGVAEVEILPTDITYGPYTFLDSQAPTALIDLDFDSAAFDQVDFVARIKRDTGIFARLEFSIFFNDGAWELVTGEGRYKTLDHGVEFTVDPITGQIFAADILPGAGDGDVSLKVVTWPT